MDEKEWIALAGVVITLLIAGWGVWVYHQNANLERAKWLERLYDRYYSDEKLKKVRDLIDSDDGATRAIVSKMVVGEAGEFTDYLNFFEFVGILTMRGQLDEQEVIDLFHYYLKLLQDNPEIRAYIADEKKGFEKLNWLLGKMFRS